MLKIIVSFDTMHSQTPSILELKGNLVCNIAFQPSISIIVSCFFQLPLFVKISFINFAYLKDDFEWSIADIRDINPSLCMYKILMKDDFESPGELKYLNCWMLISFILF